MYKVKDWDKHFENNRSRKMVKMQWVPVPNKHDGEGYAYIMSRKDGMAIFGAWNLILQVASKCHVRGSLVRGNGEPHTGETIAMKTRGDAKIIQKALEICVSPEVGWLEQLTESGTVLPPLCQEGATEGNRIEEKEENRKEDNSRLIEMENDFKNIWSLYDNKSGKAKALDSYIKARKDGVTDETIKDGIERYRKFIIHARSSGFDRKWQDGSRWFGNKSWDDDWTISEQAVEEWVDPNPDSIY